MCRRKKEREKRGGRSLVTCRLCELGSPLSVEGKRLHLVLIMLRVGECALWVCVGGNDWLDCHNLPEVAGNICLWLMENEHKCASLTSSLGNASHHPSPRLCSTDRSWFVILLHRIIVLLNWVRVLPGKTEPPFVYLSVSFPSSPFSF